jgi:hypothetical protein
MNKTICTIILLFIGWKTAVFAQGALTPPGQPAPSMTSVDQIASQGIAISAANTPCNSTAFFIFSGQITIIYKPNTVERRSPEASPFVFARLLFNQP